VADYGNFGGGRGGGNSDGVDLAQANSEGGFEHDEKPVSNASKQEVQ
jgi:hypothetical protein